MKYKLSVFFFLALCTACIDKNSNTLEINTKLPSVEATDIDQKVGTTINFNCPWNGSEVIIYFTSANVHQELKPTITSRSLKVVVPAEYTQVAGNYELLALGKDEIRLLAKVYLTSLKAEEKIISFIGPKSIRNDGDEISELSVFPQDRFGNPSSYGERFKLSKSDGGQISHRELKIDESYAVEEFKSENGQRINIGISSERANSREHQIRTLSLCPEYLKIHHDEVLSIANGRQFFKAWTNLIVDKNGQQIAAGSCVIFELFNDSEQRVGTYKAYTSNGIASTYIQNPSQSGVYILKASICGVEVAKEIGPFNSMVSKFDYQWKREGITIGPITNELGQVIANGSTVKLRITTDRQEEVISKSILNGFVSYKWSEFWTTSEPETGIIEINEIAYPIKAGVI